MENQQGQSGWNKTPGQEPNPNAFQPDNSNAVDHAQVGNKNEFEGSGKDMGIRGAPIKSMHRTSQPQGAVAEETAKPDFKIIDNANIKLNHFIPAHGHYNFAYPFNDLEVGQGMFIPIPKNGTTDKLVAHMHKQIDQFRKQNSEVEKDENGDDVMEDVAINVKKRNDDGTIQLDGNEPRLGIKSGFRPKLIGPSFTVKAVAKGDELSENNEADGDGVLVIRLN